MAAVVKGIVCRSSKVGQKGVSVSDTQNIGEEAGKVYRFGINFALQDAQFGLRYPLRRLRGVLRLPEQDAQELTELGRIVIQGGCRRGCGPNKRKAGR